MDSGIHSSFLPMRATTKRIALFLSISRMSFAASSLFICAGITPSSFHNSRSGNSVIIRRNGFIVGHSMICISYPCLIRVDLWLLILLRPNAIQVTLPAQIQPVIDYRRRGDETLAVELVLGQKLECRLGGEDKDFAVFGG